MITQNQETLRNKSLPFSGTSEELENLFNVLEFEITHNQVQGVGLSGIQINIPLQVAIIRTKTTTLNLYNARIIKSEQPFTFNNEGCMSFPGQYINTRRYNLITVLNGDGKEIKLSGFDGIIAQHEMDHWNGVIFTDRQVEESKS